MNVKNTIIGIVVIAILLVGAKLMSPKVFVQVPNTPSLGAISNPSTGMSYLQWGLGRSGGVVSIPVGGEMSVGDDEDFWKNDLGHTVWCRDGAMTLDTGTASSTFTPYLFASSTSPVPSVLDYTALTSVINGSDTFLVRGVNWATSTTATTTHSQSIAESKVIRVANGSYLIAYIQATPIFNGAGDHGSGKAEAATSTNSGLTKVKWSAQCWK